MEFRVSKKDRYKSGIYKISNTIDDRIYYGSAENFARRFQAHKDGLLAKERNCLDRIRLSFDKRQMKKEMQVSQFSLSGDFIQKFETAGEAAKKLGFNSHSVRAACYQKRPIKEHIILFSEEYGIESLSKDKLSFILSPKLYEGYSPQGELIASPNTLNYFHTKIGINPCRIYRSVSKNIECEGLFWKLK